MENKPRKKRPMLQRSERVEENCLDGDCVSNENNLSTRSVSLNVSPNCELDLLKSRSLSSDYVVSRTTNNEVNIRWSESENNQNVTTESAFCMVTNRGRNMQSANMLNFYQVEKCEKLLTVSDFSKLELENTLGTCSSDTRDMNVIAEEYQNVKENFSCLKDVCHAMKKAGVGKCNLVIGIDYTMSNISQGQRTFEGKSLHDLSGVNPYMEVICIFGETLADLKHEEDEIKAFGFGRKLFPLVEEGKCLDFMDVLNAYKATTKCVKLGGPTDFAPLIYEAIKIVEETKQFHILIIVADGQVTKEEETVKAITEASEYPLSIIVVGVGDGPWEVMKDFDDNLPERKLYNFQFVDFHATKESAKNPETEVALKALMELPEQYKELKALNLIENP